MDPKPLSLRVCFFLILLFGIAAYSNTFHVPFQYDDVSDVAGHNKMNCTEMIGHKYQRLLEKQRTIGVSSVV